MGSRLEEVRYLQSCPWFGQRDQAELEDHGYNAELDEGAGEILQGECNQARPCLSPNFSPSCHAQLHMAREGLKSWTFDSFLVFVKPLSGNNSMFIPGVSFRSFSKSQHCSCPTVTMSVQAMLVTPTRLRFGLVGKQSVQMSLQA